MATWAKTAVGRRYRSSTKASFEKSKRLGMQIYASFLLVFALAWSDQSQAQPIVNEVDIIKSLRPPGQTRSFGIERVNSETKSHPTPEPRLQATQTLQAPVQNSPQAEPPRLKEDTSTTAQVSRPQLALVIQFAVNSADIQPNSFAQLEALSSAIQSPDLEQLSFDIEGHTDASGSAVQNLRLSERRAQAISQYLQLRGVSAQRLSAVGLGPNRPIAGIPPNAPANRRVVIATRL